MLLLFFISVHIRLFILQFTNMVLKTSQKCTETAKRRMNRTQVKSSQFVSERKYSAAESVTDDVKEKVANGDGNRNNSNSGSRLGLASRSPRLSPRLSPRHHKGQGPSHTLSIPWMQHAVIAYHSHPISCRTESCR